MKTTIELPEKLLLDLKKLALKNNTTLKSLVQTAIRRLLAAEGPRKSRFTLRDCSVGGKGVQPGIQEGNWPQIRELIYEGRGG